MTSKAGMVCADCSPGTKATAWLLGEGPDTRLHLQHGPIDVILAAIGPAEDVNRAYQAATRAFEPLLEELVPQLSLLRQPLRLKDSGDAFHGDVARRMFAAAARNRHHWLTPMIAVAGAVADHLLARCLFRGHRLQRVQVNNGGDIAQYLAPGQTTRIGICTQPDHPHRQEIITLRADDGIGGIATSGWRGRSHSLGIADAVTVLATDAATADVAATLIANAVDLPDCAVIRREAASSLSPDSDLGQQRVTVDVGRLTAPECHRALQAGQVCARDLLMRGGLHAAFLSLQGETRVTGTFPDHPGIAWENTGT